jgi:O-methyltransferase
MILKIINRLLSKLDKNVVSIRGFSPMTRRVSDSWSPIEAQNIISAVRSTEHLKGIVVEVGVWRGNSAEIILENTGKDVFLFDTFYGLPKPSNEDRGTHFKEGNYRVNLHYVANRLERFRERVHIIPGLFEDTSPAIAKKKVSFAHLDVDLYESTKACLKFLYPRMIKGGIIISHDYSSTAGVRKAFDEYFREKLEKPIIMNGGSQCLIVKV